MIEPHRRASIKPLIIFMDNDGARAVAQQVSLAKRLGFETKVVERVLQLGNHLGELEEAEKADRVAAMVLDMHMPKEKTLEAIDRSHVKTEDGEAVGLAIVEGYLRDGDSAFSDVPVAFLTGRPIQSPIKKRIAKLAEGDPNDAVVVHKHEDHDVPVLEAFLKAAGEKQQRAAAEASAVNATAATKRKAAVSVAEKPTLATAQSKAGSGPPRSQAWVEVATAARIVWELFEDPAQRAGAFGLRLTKVAKVEDIERFASNYPNVDLHDRATLIIDMKMRLSALSEQRLDVERTWLQGRPAALKGDRPIDLICNGHLHDLKRVVGTLRLVTG